MFVAHKAFVGKVERAKEDTYIEMFYETVPVKKGELIFTNEKGEKSILTERQLEEDFVEVRIIQNPRIDVEKMTKGYIEMGKLIGLENKLTKDKPF